MPGETDLIQLLRTMRPELQPAACVFCMVPSLAGLDLTRVVGTFREPEGWTLILPQAAADELQLPYTFVAAWITLTVHSALEAVGLTAAVARALARSGISCNVVAAYYHDHLFVPAQDATQALQILHELAAAPEASGSCF